MEETIWKIAQVGMWGLGIQTTIILTVLVAINASFNRKLDRLEEKLCGKIEKLEEKLVAKIDKLDEKANDIDKRLFAIENILHMREYYLSKDDLHRKAD